MWFRRWAFWGLIGLIFGFLSLDSHAHQHGESVCRLGITDLRAFEADSSHVLLHQVSVSLEDQNPQRVAGILDEIARAFKHWNQRLPSRLLDPDYDFLIELFEHFPVETFADLALGRFGQHVDHLREVQDLEQLRHYVHRLHLAYRYFRAVHSITDRIRLLTKEDERATELRARLQRQQERLIENLRSHDPQLVDLFFESSPIKDKMKDELNTLLNKLEQIPLIHPSSKALVFLQYLQGQEGARIEYSNASRSIVAVCSPVMFFDEYTKAKRFLSLALKDIDSSEPEIDYYLFLGLAITRVAVFSLTERMREANEIFEKADERALLHAAQQLIREARGTQPQAESEMLESVVEQIKEKRTSGFASRVEDQEKRFLQALRENDFAKASEELRYSYPGGVALVESLEEEIIEINPSAELKVQLRLYGLVFPEDQIQKTGTGSPQINM